MNQTEEQAVIREYLLGYSDTHAESIEQRLVVDSEYLQEFLIVTDELIEDYLDGNLSSKDITRFETHFLTTPRRHRRLEMAKALAEKATSDAHSDEKATEPHKGGATITPFFLPVRNRQYWLIAAVLIVVVLGGVIAWSIIRTWPGRNASGGDLQAELVRLNDPGSEAPSGPSVLLSIAPVTVRSLGEDRRIVIQSDTQIVLVRLILVDKVYDSYQAAVETVEGNELGKTPPLTPVTDDEGRFIEVRLPAQRLESHNYRIKLSALTSPDRYMGVYPFQIIKR